MTTGASRRPPSGVVRSRHPRSTRRSTRSTWVVLAGLGLLATAGCGVDDGVGTRYSVSGRVSHRGKPLESGTITFIPEGNQGRIATGSITDGRYDLSTVSPGDGAFPGKYLVTVVAKEKGDSDASPAPNSPGYLKRIAASTKAAKSVVPAKYQAPRTSGLARDVEPRSNRFDFELGE